MKTTSRLLVCLFSGIFLFATGTSSSGQTITGIPSPLSSSSTTYDVTGTIQHAGQGFHTPYAAEASWDVHYTYNVSEGVKCCDSQAGTNKIVATKTSITVNFSSVTLTVEKPKWVQRQSCTAANSEWTRFDGAVDTHENGHINIYKGYIKNECIKGYFDDFSYESSCASGMPSQQQRIDAHKAALDVIKGVLNQWKHDIQSDSDQYDTDTHHGETQGGTLDTSISC